MKIKLHFSEYENDLKARPTLDEIKEQLATAISLGDDLTTTEVVDEAPVKLIYEFFDQFVKEESVLNQWAAATLKNWHTFKIHLESFGKRLEFRDFNERGLSRFIKHLRKVCKMEEKTVQKHYNNLKWFLNWAIRKGYCQEEAVNKFRPKFKVLDKPVIFLTKEEPLKLYTYEIPKNGTKVKLYDANGEEYEKIVQEAGALAKAILKKYENEQFPSGLALPVISNQKMNQYLKDLGELCEFKTSTTIVCYRAGQRVEET